MKDGTTHLAYKPEHAVDLDTGAVIAAELYPADQGDTTTLPTTLTSAEAKLAAVGAAPTADEPAELVTDKGYFGREVLKSLADGAWTTRIAEPKGKGLSRWHGDDAARRAVYNNRNRLLSGVAKAAFKTPRRSGRAGLRPGPRSRRHAPHLAARARERRQALSDPRRRTQPGRPIAPVDRRRDPARGCGQGLGGPAACLATGTIADHYPRPGAGSRRRHCYHARCFINSVSLQRAANGALPPVGATSPPRHNPAGRPGLWRT